MKRITSPEVLRQVASKLYLEIQQDDWPKDSTWRAFMPGCPRNVSVSIIGNTSLVEISAAHRDPYVAAKIANTIAEVYRAQAYSPPPDPREISDQGVQIMDPAVAPASPVFPDPALAVGALFLGAVLLTLGCAGMGKVVLGFRQKLIAVSES
jgi:capsular polysaccharide biosynthesis protein